MVGAKDGAVLPSEVEDFSLKLDEYVIDWFEGGLADGTTLDEAVNKALRAEMYRIRFPVRVQKAEELVADSRVSGGKRLKTLWVAEGSN